METSPFIFTVGEDQYDIIWSAFCTCPSITVSFNLFSRFTVKTKSYTFMSIAGEICKVCNYSWHVCIQKYMDILPFKVWYLFHNEKIKSSLHFSFCIDNFNFSLSLAKI